jgi:hypothetical protein
MCDGEISNRGVQILLSREQSSMVSTWEEYLGYFQKSEKLWCIGTFRYDWLGSIYDLVPESRRYSDEGELVVPEEWDGKKITGLSDGEYLQTDELVSVDDMSFTAATLKKAREFCESKGWASHSNFGLAWLQIETAVKPFQAPSKRKAFKDMPLVRSGSSASLSGYCTSELAIYRGKSDTQFWIWNTEAQSECIHKTASVLSFGQIVRTVASDERFSVNVDWFDLYVSGLSDSEGVILASAWAFEEGSKVAAQLVAKIPDQVLLPFLNQVKLEGVQLEEMGQRLLDYANNKDINLDDIESIRPRVLSDVPSLEKILMGALSRASRRQERAEFDQKKRLAPFEGEINRLIKAFRKDKPNRYYPGVGYVVPPLGAASLREFLNNQVLERQTLPTGTVQIPYSNKEMGKPTNATFFSLDLDSLQGFD